MAVRWMPVVRLADYDVTRYDITWNADYSEFLARPVPWYDSASRARHDAAEIGSDRPSFGAVSDVPAADAPF